MGVFFILGMGSSLLYCPTGQSFCPKNLIFGNEFFMTFPKKLFFLFLSFLILDFMVVYHVFLLVFSVC